jgi:hypothetical protein
VDFSELILNRSSGFTVFGAQKQKLHSVLERRILGDDPQHTHVCLFRLGPLELTEIPVSRIDARNCSRTVASTLR